MWYGNPVQSRFLYFTTFCTVFLPYRRIFFMYMDRTVLPVVPVLYLTVRNPLKFVQPFFRPLAIWIRVLIFFSQESLRQTTNTCIDTST